MKKKKRCPLHKTCLGDGSRKCPPNTDMNCYIIRVESKMRTERDVLYDFMHRVHDALKPATKKWQKATKQPLTYPDAVELIKWLSRRAR